MRIPPACGRPVAAVSGPRRRTPSSSSRAWRRAEALSGLARQHPAELDDPPVGVERGRPRSGSGRRASDLRTSICWSAWAATWARWVTTSTWAWSPSPARAAPDRGGGRPADAGVDLVEHHDARERR